MLFPAKTPGSPPPQIVAVGPWDKGDFAITQQRSADLADWQLADDVQAARELLDRALFIPQVILLAQPRPGTYHQREIEALRQAAPLTQLVLVASTWCEGELRTGQPLAGVLRVYWYELPTWLSACSPHSWTPCLDGAVAPRNIALDGSQQIHGSVIIRSLNLASFETLSSVLSKHGVTCTWAREIEAIPAETVAVWDGGQLDPAEWDKLQAFADAIRQKNGSIVVLLDFPRKEHVAMLNAIGCTALLGKPYDVGELATAVRNALRSPIGQRGP